MRVTFTTLQDAQSELDGIATDLEGHLKTLDGVVKGLAEKWRGETKGAFEETYADWTKQSAELHAALRALHALVGTAHGNYSAAKQANLAMWNGR
ncbi:WXG100 family type VII secretion target [Streptomyces sp. 8L]|uniref:WXG100 family type VII secretion target n=1 Tax=unclassified Streptomyces TaxID=2593676 RepID=UPI001CD7871D|nr:WXG100 family type VII secretion target [Streptomyces sp. 8L]MCA1222545.1 WXG100 family type VII secretion target [Streptomyces sp. 8L]